jgi:hypothetical protein
MARFRSIQNSFIAGELSPSVEGRTDLAQYKHGCKQLVNKIPKAAGGADGRNGFIYDAEIVPDLGSSRRPARLIPFRISPTEAYIVCFMDNTSLASGVEDNRGVRVWNVYQRKWATVAASSYSSGSSSLTSIASFSAIQLSELQYQIVNDVMFCVHSSAPPFQIIHLGANSFYLSMIWSEPTTRASTLSQALYFPYDDDNITSTTITPSVTGALGGTSTLTASAALFVSTMIGGTLKLASGEYVSITGVSSSTVATGYNITAITLTTRTTTWAFSAWSNYNGWPAAIAFFQNRLVYGAGTRLWFSELNDLYQMQDDGAAAGVKAFSAEQGFSDNSEIKWISPGENLTVGTNNLEILVSPVTAGSVISSVNINFKSDSSYTSCALQPVRHDNSIIFVSGDRQRIYEYHFLNNEQAFVAEHLNILSDHLHKKSIDERVDASAPAITGICVQNSGVQRIFFTDSNGGLFGMVRDRQNQIIAPFRINVGGTYTDGGGAYVYSVCSIPSTSQAVAEDIVFACIVRKINGVSVSYLEEVQTDWVHPEFYPDHVIGMPVVVDSAYNTINPYLIMTQSSSADASISSNIILLSSFAWQSGYPINGNKVQYQAVGVTTPITGLEDGATYYIRYIGPKIVEASTSGLVDETADFIYTVSNNTVPTLGPAHSFQNGQYLQYANNGGGTDIGGLTSFSYYYVVNTPAPTTVSASGLVTTATDTINITAHGYSDDYPVIYTASATAIGGLTSNTIYYIKSSTANTFKLAATSGGAAIDLTTTGTGEHTFAPAAFSLSTTSGGSKINLTGDGTGAHSFIPQSFGLSTTPTGSLVSISGTIPNGTHVFKVKRDFVYNLNHLIGEEVAVVGDSYDLGDYIVAEGDNLIDNDDAETNATGWTTYSDAAQSEPEDGTGGTATGITFTRSTSSPITGTASFSFVKDAANRRGKGVAYNFVVPHHELKRRLRISFNYTYSQSTYTTNVGVTTVCVFLFDRDRNVLVTDRNLYSNRNRSIQESSGTFTADVWLATESSAYSHSYGSRNFRLIFHVATTNASALTFKFDDVKVRLVGVTGLSDDVNTFYAGYHYDDIIETMPIEEGNEIGSGTGAIGRIDTCAIRFKDTLAAEYGKDEDSLQQVVFRPGSQSGSEPNSFFTGVKSLQFTASPSLERKIVIKKTRPLPQDVLSATMKGSVDDQ